jgi:hypothetical protein
MSGVPLLRECDRVYTMNDCERVDVMIPENGVRKAMRARKKQCARPKEV